MTIYKKKSSLGLGYIRSVFCVFTHALQKQKNLNPIRIHPVSLSRKKESPTNMCTYRTTNQSSPAAKFEQKCVNIKTKAKRKNKKKKISEEKYKIWTQQKMKKKPSEVVARLHNRPEGNANATVLCGIETSKTLINTERHTYSETHAHTHTHRGHLGNCTVGST